MSHSARRLHCCLAALLALLPLSCYTTKKFTRADLELRAAALREGRLPPDNLWLRDEYNAYWDGYGWAEEDLAEGLTYSASRHQEEVSTSVSRFYREGYAVGWRECAPDYDPADYPNARSHLQAARPAPAPDPVSRPKPAPSRPARSKQSRPKAPTPPPAQEPPVLRKI